VVATGAQGSQGGGDGRAGAAAGGTERERLGGQQEALDAPPGQLDAGGYACSAVGAECSGGCQHAGVPHLASPLNAVGHLLYQNHVRRVWSAGHLVC
jgi:hypothetical protein